MIIYNITYNIDPEIEQEWLDWMRQVYSEKIRSTELVSSLRILRLLTEIDNGGITYSFQMEFEKTDFLARFEEMYQQAFEGDHHSRFEGKYVSFRSLLKEV